MKGYLYSLTGFGHAELFVVSCTHLRDRWDGPITVLIDENEKSPIADEIAADPLLNVDVKRIPLIKARRGTRHMATKATMYIHTPYEDNVYLDCDTLPVGDLDDMFGHPLALTEFNHWLSTQRRIQNRIARWKNISPMINDMIETSTMGQAGLNTGVIGFQKSNPELYRWYDLVLQNPDSFLCDEIAMQLLFPTLTGVEIFHTRYNCSPTYGKDEEDVRLWHFHGCRRHLRKEEGRKLWLPAFHRVLEMDVANISQWAGQGDPHLDEHLPGRRQSPVA
jgi:hypothetical protein